jgi:hypothetical protein
VRGHRQGVKAQARFQPWSGPRQVIEQIDEVLGMLFFARQDLLEQPARPGMRLTATAR